MREVFRDKRRAQPIREAGFKEVYPSEFGSVPARSLPVSANAAASEAEPCRIKCAQCGAPIPDYRKISDCWNCESDNFLGARLA